MKCRRVLVCLLLTLGLSALAPAYSADTLRPEVGKPLQEAQQLIKAQKYKEALAKVQEADGVSNRTSYESFVIERMRGAAAAGAGEVGVAAKAFDAVLASGRLSNDEQLKIMQAVAESFYRAKDYVKTAEWVQRYEKAGGNDPNVHLLLIQSEYLGGDYAAAAKHLQAQLGADEKAGRTPTEDQLQLLANCYLKLNDEAGYVVALEQLVTYHPKKEYWADLLGRVQRKPGFSDRLSLDVYRLMLATGNLATASDYMDMAQLALQAGYPAEAQKVLAQGYAGKVLGTGQEAERQKRLRDLADKQAADDVKTLEVDVKAAATKTGDALINNGYDLVLNGHVEQGLALMQQGIAKADLKRPDESRLHLGEAYLLAGKPADAAKAFKAVQGRDGAQDLARLWMVHTGTAG